MEICRAFEWQSRCHGTGEEANFLYMFPIGMAISVLDAEPNDRDWIRSLLAANIITRGYGGYGAAHCDNTELSTEASTTSWRPGLGTAGRRGDTRTDIDRVKDFAFYLARETRGTRETQLSTDGSRDQPDYLSNPGLIHMLLLRGTTAGQ
ncbi:hypothetical protein F5Y19DRAFT_12342 [Xylariaceae sp. FL1651]|nr:hypothetical protein F5Y19DRAFT_12342 [Xylariaceae sp. FL1651]